MIHLKFWSCELFSEYQIPATHLRSFGLCAQSMVGKKEKRVAQGDVGATDVYESRASERHCVRGKLLYLKVSFGAPKKHLDGWPLGSSKTSLIMNSSPSLLWAHMWKNTYVCTKAPFALLISQPSCMMRSIKGLFGFYSTQAVMRHLWEANFKSHLGSLLCCRCYATLRRTCVIVSIWKKGFVYAPHDDWLPLCLGKCKSVLLSPITAACLGILFIKDVICYSALMSNLFFSFFLFLTH